MPLQAQRDALEDRRQDARHGHTRGVRIDVDRRPRDDVAEAERPGDGRHHDRETKRRAVVRPGQVDRPPVNTNGVGPDPASAAAAPIWLDAGHVPALASASPHGVTVGSQADETRRQRGLDLRQVLLTFRARQVERERGVRRPRCAVWFWVLWVERERQRRGARAACAVAVDDERAATASLSRTSRCTARGSSWPSPCRT